MKWSGLQKNVRKLTPKKFYEMSPRWKHFFATFGITVQSTIKNVMLGKQFLVKCLKILSLGFSPTVCKLKLPINLILLLIKP